MLADLPAFSKAILLEQTVVGTLREVHSRWLASGEYSVEAALLA